MIRCFLILVAITLFCAWFAPESTLGESAARVLNSSSVLMASRVEDSDHYEEEDEGEEVWAPSRRARQFKSLPTALKRKRVTPFVSKKIAARQKFRCAMCGELLQEDWEIDHVLSLQRGGSNDLSNLQALHKRCHAFKNHMEQRR